MFVKEGGQGRKRNLQSFSAVLGPDLLCTTGFNTCLTLHYGPH